MMGRPVFDPRTRCPIFGVVMLYFLKQTQRGVNESIQCRAHGASQREFLPPSRFTF
jgi:hypothetical protein